MLARFGPFASRLTGGLGAVLLALVAIGGVAALKGENGHGQLLVSHAVPALKHSGRVVDAADVLAPDVEQQVDRELAALEADTKVRMVVVTTPDLGGRDVSDYTTGLANAWGLGDADRDDGVILLVAPKDRKARISVGSGLEAILTNARCEAVMARLVPIFRNGDEDAGVLTGVRELAAMLRSQSKDIEG